MAYINIPQNHQVKTTKEVWEMETAMSLKGCDSELQSMLAGSEGVGKKGWTQGGLLSTAVWLTGSVTIKVCRADLI